jgi:hypothetical protein
MLLLAPWPALLAGGPLPLAQPASVDLHRTGTKVLASPDGARRLHLRDGILSLEGPGLPRPRHIARIRRSASVLWSPDGRAFALNDDLGSNLAVAFLFDARTGRRILALEEVLDRAFPEDVWSGHRYVRVTGWEGAATVAVTVEGHADAHGLAFALRYRVALQGGSERLARTRRGPGEAVYRAFTEPCPKG